MSGAEGGVQIHSAFGVNLDKGLFGKTSLSFSKKARSENEGLLTNEKQRSKVKKSNIHQIFVFYFICKKMQQTERKIQTTHHYHLNFFFKVLYQSFIKYITLLNI